MIIHVDAQSWRQGYDAGLDGHWLGRHDPHIADRWSWTSGYIEGQARRYQQCGTDNESNDRT